MRIRSDFKLVDKRKTIVGSIAILFCLACLGNGIATSFGTMDEDMSKFFYKAMSIPFFRGWSTYGVSDGFISIITFSVPCGIVIAESIGKGCKKNKPTGGFANHQSVLTGLLYLVGVIYLAAICIFLGLYLFQDHGMGQVTEQLLVGHKFTIPVFIVCVLVNFSLYVFLNIYVHKYVATKPDFLESKPGRGAIHCLVFLVCMYIVAYFILKQALGRPYGGNIHGNDPNIADNPMNKLKTEYPSDGEKYLNQDKRNGTGKGPFGVQSGGGSTGGTLDNQTLNPDVPTNGKGGMVGDGGAKSQGASLMPHETGFPSGHTVALQIVGVEAYFLMRIAPINKKTKDRGSGVVVAVAYLYILNLFECMETSTLHGGSDLMFSASIGPLFYFISGLVTDYFADMSYKDYLIRKEEYKPIRVK